jgi:dTDP-4-amino-4,6-dideoxygalactose transaminase
MGYKIPLFDLNYNKAEEGAVLKALRSKWISMGPTTRRLEEKAEERFGVKNAVALTNCTAALHTALKILEIGEGDEVIVPSMTFVATVNSVRYVKAVPVFADITSCEDLSVDPYDIEKKITAKTKGIIVMHYGGFACNMDKIMRIAKKYKVYIIEDAAHAPDSEYYGKKLGTIGDIGCYSFFSNKNITCAEGGMLVTNRDDLAQKAALLRSHGMTSLSYDRLKGHSTIYDVVELGYNYRIDDIRSALALTQFKKLNADIKKRAELRAYYLNKLKNADKIVIPYADYKFKSSNYIFPIVLKNGTAKRRDAVRQELAKAGIQTSVHYPAAHKFMIYRQFGGVLPKTDYASDCEITLPLFYSLTKRKIDFIASALLKALREN